MNKILVLLLLLFIALPVLSQEKKDESRNYIDQTLPSTSPVVFAPDIVSNPGTMENGCCFSPDGKEFYFTRQNPQEQSCHILVCRLAGQSWSSPEPVCFSQDGMLDFEPHVSVDNKYLFFTRLKPDGESFKNGIWCSVRTENGWSDPEFSFDGMFVSSLDDGRIVFTDTNAADKRAELVIAEFRGGKLTSKQPLSRQLDSPYLDSHPCIAPDGSFLVFSSKRHNQDKGYFDLFIAFRKKDDTWGPAQSFGDLFGKGVRMCPALTPDGNYLLFTQFGAHGADIYWVSMEAFAELK